MVKGLFITANSPHLLNSVAEDDYKFELLLNLFKS